MQTNRGIPAGFESDDEDDFLLEMQKVTVVPQKVSTGAGLDGEDFDTTLPDELEKWFQGFRETYNIYKRSPFTEQQLKLVLVENENPLLLALKIFAISPGCNNLKNKNLALFVLELSCELAAKNPILTQICGDNARMVAFNFIKLCGINSIYKAVIKAYGLKSIRHRLLPKLQELLTKGHYKDVAYWTIFLEMTESFGVFELIFPLMLQDKVFLAEEYIDIAQNLQLPVVQFLDSLLNREKTVYEHCDDILTKHNYIDVRHGLLIHKPMLKLVARLAKKYKISEKHTPNLVYSKSCNYLRYLFYKYREGGMNCEAWRELVPDVAQSREIQMELIRILSNHGDPNEALYWLQKFEIAITDCSDEVQNILNQHLCQIKTDNESTTDKTTNTKGYQNQKTSSGDEKSEVVPKDPKNNDEYLKLNLNENQIILVDDETKFNDMINFLKTQPLIGFDSEWKPSVSSENIVSLLQLATSNRVYLLDCISSNIKVDHWKSLGRQIFNNLEILKIGFALDHDLHMLQKSLPLQLNLQGGKVCFLDLRELWRRLRSIKIIKLPYENSEDAGEGLSALTEACFGKKLDKSNQCSNWANRPLRQDQQTYAALDAHCLLQIYDIFAENLRIIGLDIDKVVEEVTTGKTGYLFQMKTSVIFNNVGPSTSSIEKNQIESNQAFLSASDICFICEEELIGLTKELRKLGIDCTIISNLELEFYLVDLKKSHCFLLTQQPQRYYHLLKDYGRDKCIKIHQNSSGDQAVYVLNHFNIKVQEHHLYTRCLECNSNEFILALKEDIQQMRNSKVHETQENKDMKTANVIRQHKHVLLHKINEHILTTKLTYSGNPIRLRRIKDHHLKTVEQFFICNSCGYVIWSGAHPMHARVAKTVDCETQRFPRF